MGKYKNDVTTLENCLAVVYEVKHTLTIHLAIALLNVYPSEMKGDDCPDVHTQMFLAALFPVVLDWNH